MAGLVWVSDREPGVRELFAELMPDAEVLTPDELDARSALGQRPDALVIDGTQLMELPARRRSAILALPRVLICTGMLLASMPMKIVRGPNVAVLAKPFCMEDLEAALDWLRGTPSAFPPASGQLASMLQRPRSRRSSTTLPIA
jgi:hypothetical protein